MTEIRVSDNFVVDYGAKHWRLIRINDHKERKTRVAVGADGGFRYDNFFANTRDLPDEGEISAAEIAEVVLRWSYEADAWRLAITLSPDLSATRSGSRCEVLRFIDPDQSVYEQDAKRVGEALAAVLDKPFVNESPTTPPPPKPIPLIDLPLEVGIWHLQAGTAATASGGGPGEVRFVRCKSWMRAKVRQIVWYALLALIYVWVSAASINSELALPNAGTLIPDPQILPYLGLGVAVLLLLLIAQQLWHILREPDTILISSYEQGIIALRSDRVCWREDARKVQSVYASELMKKRGRHPIVHHSEINLHLVEGGGFRRLIVEDAKLTDALLPGMDPQAAMSQAVGVTVLEPHRVSTALQASAIHISACLDGLPVWYDRRYK